MTTEQSEDEIQKRVDSILNTCPPATDKELMSTVLQDHTKKLLHRFFLEGVKSGLHATASFSEQNMRMVQRALNEAEGEALKAQTKLRPLS